ncbi:MAG TPA: methyltransferase type 12 [Blastocatellia bacterium]|jgi:ubiquinone/menaquinone biosynthesis C-methylase UbiE|nr:methyltransferase type 12 [Blastocatellia bacterium]HAF22367.1 methyltransferase type 12 [Blastocatellia bacterium]
MSSPAAQQPSPQLFFQTINAYQRTEGLKAAIELEAFTAIGEGNTTAPEIAKRCGASERGTRILCDFLCIMGFLNKDGSRYSLTPDSAMFLDKRSPAYLGGAIEFISSPMITESFKNFTEVVRKGGTTMTDGGTIAPENPIWVKFARAMAPMMALPAQLTAKLVDPTADRKLKILDIAAGHGLYGLAFAKNNSQASVVALDWPNVLEVAKENARNAGVAERYSTIEGSAFDVDFGAGYDLILLTNFLHHFDPPTNEVLLRKVYAALAEGGRAVTLEFVPNEDRISPPDAAAFSVTMLGSTPSGDAYTFPELESMFTNAGFSRSEIHRLPPSIQQAVISQK